MKKIIEQFLKFGLVGIVCFFVDYIITMALYIAIDRATGFAYSELIGSFFGFTVSVIVNYILSMKYVFVRREDIGHKQEFIIFVILSLIGLVINLIVMWFLNHPIYENWGWLNSHVSEDLVVAVSKIVATFIVMVWNFISRKIFLEQKES